MPSLGRVLGTSKEHVDLNSTICHSAPRMNRHPKLTNTETIILQFLAERYHYAEIASRLKTSVASIHTHVSNIRRKTKIADLKDLSLCKTFLATFAVGKRAPGPTPQQTAILKMYYIERKSISRISDRLNIGMGTVANGLCQGRKRIPFELARGKEKAAEQLQKFFAELEGGKPFSTGENPMDDPMF